LNFPRAANSDVSEQTDNRTAQKRAQRPNLNADERRVLKVLVAEYDGFGGFG
jgi:hypothetical protein